MAGERERCRRFPEEFPFALESGDALLCNHQNDAGRGQLTLAGGAGFSSPTDSAPPALDSSAGAAAAPSLCSDL